MASRTPVYWDGTDIREMSAAMITAVQQRCVYLYGTNPSVTLSVVSSGGNISPNMNDTRKSAGAYRSFTTRFPTEAETAEPGTITVTYDRVSQTLPTIGVPADTSNVRFPIYQSSGDLYAMSLTDMYDTFISPSLNLLVSSSDRDGTYRIHTATSLTNHTLMSSTPVFTDTRANVAAYTAGSIPEALDQPTTISNFYLFRTNAGTTYGSPSVTGPLYIRSADNHLQSYTNASFDAILLELMRYYANQSIRYSINGTGNNKGSAMTNTILNGSGNYQTRFVNADDYRAQEFPNGTAVVANTWYLRITRI